MCEHNDKFNSKKCKKETPIMMIHFVSKVFGDNMRKASEKVGLKGSYRHLMFHLSHEDNLTQLDLVKRTKFKAPTISVSLQNMEQDGLVTRKSDENDLRQTRVSLTEEGRKLDDKIKKEIDILENQAMKNFTDEEVETLRKLIEKVKQNLLNE